MDAVNDTQSGSSTSETNRVYGELRDRIISGRIPPGERLKVETLKAALNVGASPIREALSLLTSDQLVERIDRRGFRAAKAGADHFAEILRLRCALEDLALRESIEKGDDRWEEELVLSHHRLARADRTEIAGFEEKHKAFHMMLLSACGSPILLKFCSQLYDLNIRYRYLAKSAVSYAKRDIAKEHAEILEAVVSRDAETASARLMAHYRKTGDFLSGILKKDGSFTD